MRLQTEFGRIEVTAIVTDTDAVLAYWKQHWPADRDERARRERDNLHQFVDLVKPERARLRQANVLVVNAGPKAVLEHLEAKTRIAIDPNNDRYIAEGLLRPRDGDGGTMYLNADLRDGSLPAEYFDFVFLDFRVADAAEAFTFLKAALRVTRRWGRIGVNLIWSRMAGSRDEELLQSALPGYGHSLQLQDASGSQLLRGWLQPASPAGRPKLSVVVFTYNHRPFIAQALNSVLMQETNFPFEIVVLDDASTDGTREIIEQYSARHPGRFRLVFNEKNVGIDSPAGMKRVWWELLRRSDGEYTALCDGDDYWTSPHKLQKQVDFLDAQPDFIFCGHENNVRSEWHGTVTETRRRFPDDTALSVQQLLECTVFQDNSMVYRNGILRDCPKEFLDLLFADWPLQILLAQLGGAWMFAEPMSVYRFHPGGFWSSRYADKQNLGCTPEGWEVIIDYWKLINKHLGYEYDTVIQKLIASTREQIAAQAASH